MDARGFNRELKRWINEDVKGRTLTAYKKIVRDLGRSVVLDTPVDTGQARGNWRFTTSKVSAAYDPRKLDPRGTAAIGRLEAVIARLRLSDPVYITNNVPYIEKLETGWSQQAPAGMLGRNIARVSAKYRVL